MIMKSNTLERELSEEEIDAIVIAEANDDSAWEEPIEVIHPALPSISLPPELAGRVAFCATLHNESIEDWLLRIIRERLEAELHAYTAAQRERAQKHS